MSDQPHTKHILILPEFACLWGERSSILTDAVCAHTVQISALTIYWWVLKRRETNTGLVVWLDVYVWRFKEVFDYCADVIKAKYSWSKIMVCWNYWSANIMKKINHLHFLHYYDICILILRARSLEETSMCYKGVSQTANYLARS